MSLSLFLSILYLSLPLIVLCPYLCFIYTMDTLISTSVSITVSVTEVIYYLRITCILLIIP